MPDQLRLFKIKADVSINKMVIPLLLPTRQNPVYFFYKILDFNKAVYYICF